jgi:predicted O-methyltransferase YrrM
VISLPKDFENFTTRLIETMKSIEGSLSEKEMKFLALLAACPTAKGEILEIGSFKGKSTIILAKGASLTAKANVVAVDPLTSPATTDPDLKGQESSSKDFQINLRNTGVEKHVEFHRKRSCELAEIWNRDIRLLWIDGDHTYAGTKSDFDMFSRFLSNGAIVAIHDVLNNFEGTIRVFLEDVLLSKHFGPAGMCGSIGWSQYFKDPNTGRKFKHQKNELYIKLRRLLPYCVFGRDIKGLAKIKHKVLRWKVPHGDVNPSEWLREVMFIE